MFGIGGWEFILIAVLALLLFGPDKLPQFARTLGRFLRDLKRYQDLMESTIRAEVYAGDSEKKDPFKTGKEFRERVASGGFAKSAEAEADDGTEGTTPEVGESAEQAPAEEPAAEQQSAPAEDVHESADGEQE